MRCRSPLAVRALMLLSMCATIPSVLYAGAPKPSVQSRPKTGQPEGTKIVKLASDCFETDITDVLGDGAIVKTTDGHMYEIHEIDRIDTALWLPVTEVVVCWERYRLGEHIVTTYTLRAEGDKVDADRLR